MQNPELILQKFEQLDSIQQETVIAFIDSLLLTQSVKERDDQWLRSGPVWTDQDVEAIEKAQSEINQWQIPMF